MTQHYVVINGNPGKPNPNGGFFYYYTSPVTMPSGTYVTIESHYPGTVTVLGSVSGDVNVGVGTINNYNFANGAIIRYSGGIYNALNATINTAQLGTEGTIKNNGTINGVSLQALGTVTNAGTINGIFLQNYGDIANELSGIIAGNAGGNVAGGKVGIYSNDDDGNPNAYGPLITNAGTINATGVGIALRGPGGSITNGAAGHPAYIGGGQYGIFLQAPTTITNYGKIASPGSAGVSAIQAIYGFTQDATLTNRAAGTIQGGNYGILAGVDYNFRSFIAIDNYGLIQGTVGGAWNTTYLTNEAGGTITGGRFGVYDGAFYDPVITNSGAITSPNGSAGIGLGAAGTVVNAVGGYIHSPQFGIHNGTSITNSGTISGASGGVFGSIYVNNLAHATITGGALFVQTLVNDGQISNTSATGAYVGSFNNKLSGSINGQSFGVVAYANTGSTKFTNAGTIGGSTRPAVGFRDKIGGSFTNTYPTSLLNAAAIGFVSQLQTAAVFNYGLISAGNAPADAGLLSNLTPVVDSSAIGSGIYLQLGGRITNGNLFNRTSEVYGTINGILAGYAPPAQVAAGTSMTNWGTIAGQTGDGVYLRTGGTVINPGMISGGNIGIRLGPGQGTISNSFSVTGTNGIGIETFAGENVTNQATAYVSGAVYGILVNTANAPGSVANYGTIVETGHQAAYNGSTRQAGIEMVGGGTVIDSGYVGGANGIALRNGASGAVTIAQTGSITAGSIFASNTPGFGVSIAGVSGYVKNLGQIVTKQGSGVGVGLNAGGGVYNGFGALIFGATYGVLRSGSGTITNKGTIRSAGTAVVLTGTAQDWIVNYGTISGTGATAISLSGDSDTVVIEPGSLLIGAVANLAIGDDIDFVNVNASFASFSFGTLFLRETFGGSVVASVQLGSSPEMLEFKLSSDHNGGTDVQLTAGSLKADLTGSGASQLLMTNNNTDALVDTSILGDPTAAYTQIGGLGPEWQFEGDGDLLGDGNTGFLLWDSLNGAIVVGEDVAGTAQYTLVGGVGSEWQFEGNAPFLGNGQDQILLWSNQSGALVLGSVAAGGLQFSQIGGVGPEWQFEGTGDYLGDGNSDFLMWDTSLSSPGYGSVVVGEVANGTAQYTLVGGLDPTVWRFEGSGDLLGHGQDDFMIWDGDSADPNYGDVVVGEVVNGSAQYTLVGGLGPEWQFLGVGNYDGQSNSEFMIRNGNTGALVIGTVANGGVTYAAVGGVGAEWDFHTANVATLT